MAERIALIPPDIVAAQQAHRAPGDGRHGPAGGHPVGHRAVRARHQPAQLPHLHRGDAHEGAHQGPAPTATSRYGDYRTERAATATGSAPPAARS